MAQEGGQHDVPRPHVPARPPTQREVNQHQALQLFAEAVMCEREDRLLEAMRVYELAAKLDPDAVTVQKSLLMIYIAVERHDEAGKLLKRVLELNPHDFEMSYLHARQLRSQGKLDEACKVLLTGLQAPALRDRPDMQQQMEFDLGVLYERLEKHLDAAAAFGRAAAILDHPDRQLEGRVGHEEIQMRSAEIHERIGRNYLDMHEFDKAIAAFQDAQAKYPPGAGRLHYHLAQVQLRQGKLNEAVSSLQNYLQMMPQGTDAYELMIGLLQKMKRDAEIVPWLEQASAKDTFNVGLRLLLAKQCAKAGQTTKAEKIYRDMAEAGPSEQVYKELFLLYKEHHPRGPVAIGEMINDAFEAANRKDNPLANNSSPAQVKAMVAALRANDDLARAVLAPSAKLAEKKPLHIDTLQIFGAIADRLNMLPEAEIFYVECVKQPLPVMTEPLIYGGMQSVMWKAGHFEALVDATRIGLKQAQPINRVLLRGGLAQALGHLERWDEAIAEADIAVSEAIGPEKFKLRLLRVRILTGATKFTEAEAECQAMLKDFTLPGEAIEVHYLLSNVYSATKKNAESEAELLACLKIDGDSIAVNNDLGYQWADQGKNLPQAEAMIRKAIDLDRKSRKGMFTLRPDADKEFKDNACYIDSLGWVLFHSGQIEAARKELEYAATLPDSDDPVIFDHLGDVYLALGLRDEALTAWRQAIHFYGEGKRRKMDDRLQTLKERVKQLEGK